MTTEFEEWIDGMEKHEMAAISPLDMFRVAWDARGKQDALIADERAKIFPDSNKFYNCNDELRTVCEDIAEDIRKL